MTATYDTPTRPLILFVCQLNAVRSPMAEGLARDMGFDAKSCGLDPANEPDSLMVSVMGERGIDMSNHDPVSLRAMADQTFDHIFTFSQDSLEAVKAIYGDDAPVELWTVPNPNNENYDVRAIMNTYRSIRDVIDTRLQQFKKLHT